MDGLLYDAHHSLLRPLGFAEMLPKGPIADTVYRRALYASRTGSVQIRLLHTDIRMPLR